MELLRDLFLDSGSTLLDAMKMLNKNGRGICFIRDGEKVIGSITDGDIRRCLVISDNTLTKVEEAMNREFFYLDVDATPEEIRRCFKKDLKVIPLLNRDGKLVDVADAYTNHLIPIIKPSLQGNELEYLTDCITSNWISSQGKYVQEFERMFSTLHEDRPTISVSNGTTALHLALMSLGIEAGDEVIVPDITFAASANSVVHCNAVPVLCEVERDSLCIDIESAEMLITPRTKAIMPVHLYGEACNMSRVMDLAHRYNLKVVEDCAEGLGSKWEGKPVGTFGDAATFSFFGNKTVTTGEGGMIVFRESSTCSTAQELRDHGMSRERKYWHEKIGFNYRMTNMQAALGVAQMERFEEIIESKVKLGMRYISLLSGSKKISWLPQVRNEVVNSFWLFTVVLDKSINRDFIMAGMKELGVEVRPVFYPLHAMPPFESCLRSKELSISRWVSAHGISLPSSVDLTSGEQEYICDRLLQLLDG